MGLLMIPEDIALNEVNLAACCGDMALNFGVEERAMGVGGRLKGEEDRLCGDGERLMSMCCCGDIECLLVCASLSSISTYELGPW